jgi:dihydrolipoamide dehydrogenase
VGQATDYDIVVLGGGSGGYSTALRAAQLGLTVALIEQDKLGGTCLHYGCIPTKAMLHVAEVADQARESAPLGVKSTFEGVDVEAMHAFKQGVVARLHKGLEGLVGASDGVTYVKGSGRLTGPRTVTVGGSTYTGGSLVLATGSTPRSLPGVPIGGRVITSTEALNLSEIPEHVVIIGGSVIGVEFASAWRSLGAQVTIVEALPSLVPLEEPVISKQLERAFRRRKIGVRTGVGVAGVEQHDAAAVVLLEDGDKLEADYVLVAIGRAPVTQGLGFEEAGIKIDDGCVRTDDRLATSGQGVYAVGDLVRGPQLAHRGFAHGIFVAEEIAGMHPVPVLDANIPRVTYCEPEIASVGLTEAQARAVHDEVRVVQYDLGGNGKSQILQAKGTVKVVSVPDGPIVGVHMIGSRLGEQAGEAALMVGLATTPLQVSSFVHAHPTQNEALGEAVLALAGKPLHTHA